ncbi:D-alanine--D-alanine ligase [Coraliomargarita sinensis]|uniref:D-alanine--D-alanine ligase n=1 Tax=Coraliomargarita sinensis TaxID=2174842 RepID=A0A317ZI50_9BACT|nr:D-alanine--D-alanine ligase [Coraliomargarita sinensis]PXA05256.1 D-alanine--D-alanine ligase [Coraliomargarita sinensis]
MSDPVKILILHGGTSKEREVSLASGRAVADALELRHTVELVRLDQDSLPDGIQSADTVVFPALHGTFGEDGQLQALLDAAGVEYCGSGAAASRLCMDKVAAKVVAREQGVPTPDWMTFDAEGKPLADDVIAQLGPSLVVKPVDQGSSVGLHFSDHRSALGVALSQVHRGKWLIEQRITGRELTVGLLEGKAMGVVEIVSSSGVYDYQAKYTPGSTEYLYPAKLKPDIKAHIQRYAERLFAACGCRDFARVDFLLDGESLYFLEINTLPGLTTTSLLPKSASCAGYDFEMLAEALVAPAVKRLLSAGNGEEAP